MQHTELLHRFFDDGLEESLEDILFERMAVDPDLRREFLQHLKLHSMIQEDVASITTPSHVSQQLFVNLGLTPPAHVPAAGLRQKIGALAAGLRSQIAAKRRYIYTALGSAVVTALLILGLGGSGSDADTPDQALHLPGSTVEQNAPDAVIPSGTDVSTEARERAQPLAETVVSAPVEAAQAPAGTTALATSAERARPQAGTAALAASAEQLQPQAGTAGSASPVQPIMQEARQGSSLADAGRTTGAPADNQLSKNLETMHASALSIPGPRSIGAFTGNPVDDADAKARLMALADIESVLKEAGDGGGQWHFFRPGPRANILSNLVFELRKYYGQSFPDVDQAHNSHNVFEDMALSVVYKVTEHHAFGFEYGREGFGRSFQDYEPVSTVQLDASIQELFDPPETMRMREVRESRMLDLFGAVWKLSLPEYGMFGVVYPYMRSFVGATRLGPLGKVRIGLEMFPSNFSMLNVGIEGGLLRYSVEDMAYYTSKLNFTFGVAIGF